MNPPGKQVCRLLPNDLLALLERLRPLPVRSPTSRGRGEHLAGRGGHSTDFADYRDYTAGDDMRSVDWNIFARLQRPYLRLFRLEEDRHLVIVVDASASMQAGGKLARARSLAVDFDALRLLPTDEDIQALNADGYLGDVIATLRDRQGGADPQVATQALALLTTLLAERRAAGGAGAAGATA